MDHDRHGIWHEKIYQVYTKCNFFNFGYTRYIQIYLFWKTDMTWIWHGYDILPKKYTWCCNIHVISMGYDIKWGVCERVWVSRRAWAQITLWLEHPSPSHWWWSQAIGPCNTQLQWPWQSLSKDSDHVVTVTNNITLCVLVFRFLDSKIRRQIVDVTRDSKPQAELYAIRGLSSR